MSVTAGCAPLRVAEWDDTHPPVSAAVATVTRVRGQAIESVEDHLADEVPVAFIYNGISHVVMLATPADVEDFALGFSLTEGIITQPNQLYGIELKTVSDADGLKGIEVHIDVATEQFVLLKEKRRNLVGRTGCGLCGAESLQQVFKTIPTLHTQTLTLNRLAIDCALQALPSQQPLQQLTGASHACALVDAAGHVLCVREDVGRHNALDKLLGTIARQPQYRQHLQHTGWVLTTSRASYEMVQKIAMVGGRALVALSAPTALAVTLAQQHHVSLIGFAKPHQCVVYHGQLI